MYRSKVIRIINDLKLPKGQFIVFGGATLAIRNLRDVNDIDLFITDRLYDKLLKSGWRESSTDAAKKYLILNVAGIEIQAYKNWQKSGWQPKFKDYLQNPEVINGIPLMPLAEMRQWKVYTAREKDLYDVELIDKYSFSANG